MEVFYKTNRPEPFTRIQKPAAQKTKTLFLCHKIMGDINTIHGKKTMVKKKKEKKIRA